MALVLHLQRSPGTRLSIDKGSRRAPDKNCCTVTLANSTSAKSFTAELNREEAEALADALKKAVAR